MYIHDVGDFDKSAVSICSLNREEEKERALRCVV
jgi:hypothetical protein